MKTLSVFLLSAALLCAADHHSSLKADPFLIVDAAPPSFPLAEVSVIPLNDDSCCPQTPWPWAPKPCCSQWPENVKPVAGMSYRQWYEVHRPAGVAAWFHRYPKPRSLALSCAR